MNLKIYSLDFISTEVEKNIKKLEEMSVVRNILNIDSPYGTYIRDKILEREEIWPEWSKRFVRNDLFYAVYSRSYFEDRWDEKAGNEYVIGYIQLFLDTSDTCKDKYKNYAEFIVDERYKHLWFEEYEREFERTTYPSTRRIYINTEKGSLLLGHIGKGKIYLASDKPQLPRDYTNDFYHLQNVRM